MADFKLFSVWVSSPVDDWVGAWDATRAGALSSAGGAVKDSTTRPSSDSTWKRRGYLMGLPPCGAASAPSAPHCRGRAKGAATKICRRADPTRLVRWTPLSKYSHSAVLDLPHGAVFVCHPFLETRTKRGLAQFTIGLR